MLIRPAAARDVDALTDLHLDVWDEAYAHLIPTEILLDRRRHRAENVRRWRESITRDPGRTLLAWDEDGGRLLGFVNSGPGRDAPRADLPDLEIRALYARHEMHGRGVGHALLNAAIGTAAAYLWVLDGNDRAIGFYRRQGFHFDGTTRTEPEGLEHRMVRPQGSADDPGT